MAHFAKIGVLGFVEQVIVAEQDFIHSGAVGDPAQWIETSYNTRANVHYGTDGQPDGGTPLRKNFARIGDLYDKNLDAFYYPVQPYPSWSLNTETCQWQAPVAYPTDGAFYVWDENLLAWQAVPEIVLEPDPEEPAQ